jgi:TatD DNase family protein
MKYVDIHGHVNFATYDEDREAVINRAQEAGVGIVSVGVDLQSSKKALELAESHPNMWAVVGMHPTNVAEFSNKIGKDDLKCREANLMQVFDYDEFKKLAFHPKVIAIGECGLDYFHSKTGDMDGEREVFIEHINLANEVNKPLMLHVRNGSTGSAYQETIAILKRYAKVRANFHFFAGTLEDMKSALEIDAMFSFTGVVTFARSYDELVRALPADRIMSETDCPYVAPVPYRGRRNEPTYVVEVVKAIAEIRGERFEALSEQLLQNARDFFTCISH